MVPFISNIRPHLVFFICIIVIALNAAADSGNSEGFSFYRNYLKIASEAETINDIAAYMPAWWRSRYEAADQQTQTAAVERTRNTALDLKDVVLVKEEAVENGVRLHMTATEQNGFPMEGKVLLIKESSMFTVEESKWATKQ